MAEPQANPSPQTEQARAKGNAAQTSEARTFDEARGGHGPLAQATRPGEGGWQIAEQGRTAGRQVTDAWRQAVDPFLALQLDISQWFDDLMRQTFGFSSAPSAHPLRPFGHLSPVSLFGLPPADMKETEKTYQLAIELPGLKREDIDIAIVGANLVICGHKAQETEDASASYRVSERRYGRFERTFPLPPDIDRTVIQAAFRDGILRVTLPKNPSAAPQRARIEIKG